MASLGYRALATEAEAVAEVVAAAAAAPQNRGQRPPGGMLGMPPVLPELPAVPPKLPRFRKPPPLAPPAPRPPTDLDQPKKNFVHTSCNG